MFLMLLCLFMVGLVVLIGTVRTSGDRWNQTLAAAAKRQHGQFVGGGWFGEPTIRFLYGTSHARLTCYGLRGTKRRCVQLVMEQADVHARCEIMSQPSYVRLAPDSTHGMEQIEFDWAGPKARWRVMAQEGDEARHLFTSAVRMALDRVWLHPLPTETHISLMPGWMIVRKAWDTPRSADIEQFIESACTLHDQLQVASTVGIEFIVGDEPQIIDDALCSICGETMEEALVFCRRCKTPHHRECWEYYGGCSTYACGERMFFVPSEAPLAAPHWMDNAAAPAPKPAKPR